MRQKNEVIMARVTQKDLKKLVESINEEAFGGDQGDRRFYLNQEGGFYSLYLYQEFGEKHSHSNYLNMATRSKWEMYLALLGFDRGLVLGKAVY